MTQEDFKPAVDFIVNHKMRFFLVTVSERFGTDDWVVRENISGGLGPPLFVGAKEAAEYEAARLNREESARYAKASSDHVMKSMEAAREAIRQEHAVRMEQLLRYLEERARNEEELGRANDLCLTALSLPD